MCIMIYSWVQSINNLPKERLFKPVNNPMSLEKKQSTHIHLWINNADWIEEVYIK